MPCGLRRRRTIAVRLWAGAARLQLCQRQHRRFRQRHSQRRRPRRRPRHRRRCHPQRRQQRRQHQLDPLIHTIALLGNTSLGKAPNSNGAAGSTIPAGSRHSHQPPQTPTIARTGSRIGRPGGLSPRRNGAAGCMARAARIRAVDVSPRMSRTIATLDSPIGWQVGQWPRRPGAVRTRARVARRQPEDVPEGQLTGKRDSGAGLRAIFRCQCHVHRR